MQLSSQKIEIKSPNFSFLAQHDKLLLLLAAESEYYCFRDPQVSLIKQRQLSEAVAATVAASVGEFKNETEELLLVLNRLEASGILQRDVAALFHSVRKNGNRAVHENKGTQSDALHGLKMCRTFCVWFHQAFGIDKKFKPGPFIPPPDPKHAEDELIEELADLRLLVQNMEQELHDAKSKIQDETKLRQEAELKAQDAYSDLEAALELAEQTEEKLGQQQKLYFNELENVQQNSIAKPETIKALIAKVEQANGNLRLDESDTRRLIDQQLRDSGWEADSDLLRYSKGIRPQKGKNIAIAEWPTKSGPVDYALFIDLELVGLVEAKKQDKDVSAVLKQTARYSRDYVIKNNEVLPEGAPWNGYKAPFIFSTNGKAFLEQVRTQSGIWFQDLRISTNLARPLVDWYTPQGLAALLKHDIETAQKKLQDENVDFLWLREYQKGAIREIEKSISQGQRKILIAMSTGTGKTRVALALMYRALKASRFRRILFLVDRESLGTQAAEVFQNIKVESLSSLYDIYDIKELGDRIPEKDTRVHIATIQGMVRRLLYKRNDNEVLPIDSYDCIIVDECHRGYTMDHELSDEELLFRNERDYISKYRRVLDHFDAVKVGVTATPALHTTEIFGKPVFNYSYRQAVIDGYLVDHEPPVRIVTKLAEDGIHWKKGDEIKRIDLKTNEIDLSITPDEVDFEVDNFNSSVITEKFNITVCNELAKHIDPALPGKTLIFCVNDKHADMVVYFLKLAFKEVYGQVEDDAVLKITGNVDDQKKLIRLFKNETLPNVAVTVDLLTTGIDVEEIVNLVFIRRVKSRILFEQMLGRATRLCEDLYGKGEDKDVFRIYDAVDIYSALEPVTAMKPVVAQPTLKIANLVEELQSLSDEKLRVKIVEDIAVRFRRNKKKILRAEQVLIDEFGLSCNDLEQLFQSADTKKIEDTFARHPKLAPFIDAMKPGERRKIAISEHEDELRSVEHGYGIAEKPEDYIEAFTRWIKTNVNEITALKIVTQRPRDLTRKDLKEIKEKLDAAGFTEVSIGTAWRECKNEEIAANIIGYIRTQALGSALIPYAERVDSALKRILKKQSWSIPQRTWLQNIAKQIKKEVIVDRDALDSGQFKADGGFRRLDKTFDGKLSTILQDFLEEIWQESA
jgi:type I restriction enzyme R subunit